MPLKLPIGIFTTIYFKNSMKNKSYVFLNFITK